MKERVERILIVEDEMDISRLLQLQVDSMGYGSDAVSSGEWALDSLNEKIYGLIILDWMLPGLSGIEMTRQIRKKSSFRDIPILMLTAKSDPENIVEGLEAGVDDYVTKPFRPEVLKARIIALLRRARRTRQKESMGEGDEIKMGPLRVSLKSYKAYLEGEMLNLTPSEIKLLITMLKFRGRVLTRDRLIEEVQGEGVSVVGRTVDTHVFGLRKKFGVYSEIIETVRGVGYRVRDDVF